MKKRVLILVGIPNFDYSNENSAVLLFLRIIRNAFEEAGYQAEFPFEESNSANGIKSIKSNPSKLKALLKKWNWLNHSLAYRSYKNRQAALLNQLMELPRFDLVVEFHTVGSIIGKVLSHKWKCPFSVVFDAPIDEQYVEMHGTKTIYWKVMQASEKLTIEAADKIMVYSPACEDYIRAKYTIKGMVGVLPCIVEKPFTVNHPDDSCFRILFIGSFLKWHKVDLLIQVFSEFLSVNPSAKLQLIGFGQEWENTKVLVSQLNISDAVEMPGFVSDETLLEYKRRASIGVMPGSNWYGSPLKLFEYAQSGIPFIAPDSKTVRSIFSENEHCLFIDANNEKQSLLNGIKRLYQELEVRAKLGTNANRLMVENYQRQKYLEDIMRVLDA